MGHYKIKGPRKRRWRPPPKPKPEKPPKEPAWERAARTTVAKPKPEPQPPPPPLTGAEVRAKMERYWNEGRIQNAKRPARWILPGGNGGYVIE